MGDGERADSFWAVPNGHPHLSQRSYRCHALMQAFMWQDDLIGVAESVNAGLHKMGPLRVKHPISLVWLEKM